MKFNFNQTVPVKALEHCGFPGRFVVAICVGAALSPISFPTQSFCKYHFMCTTLYCCFSCTRVWCQLFYLLRFVQIVVKSEFGTLCNLFRFQIKYNLHGSKLDYFCHVLYVMRVDVSRCIGWCFCQVSIRCYLFGNRLHRETQRAQTSLPP